MIWRKEKEEKASDNQLLCSMKLTKKEENKMFNYFKLPNSIFTQKLTSTEVAVAAALYSARTGYRAADGHIVVIKQSTICKNTGIKCTETVCNAINRLSLLGIIKRIKRRYKRNGHLGTYQYTLSFSGKYSTVDRNVFKLGLSPALLRVYLFLNKCIDKKLNRCWNSYKDIAEQLSMARSRVIEIVKTLVGKGLIQCKKIIKSNGCYSDNHYSIIPQREKTKKRELVALEMQPVLISYPLALSKYFTLFYNKRLCAFCQGFLRCFFCFIRGSPKNWVSPYITHYIPTEKR